MSLLGILLLIMGIWLLIYIKITNLIVINYHSKIFLPSKLAIIIKNKNNKLAKSLQSIKKSNTNYDIYIFNNVKNIYDTIRTLNKKYDGYFILDSNIIINKNYFKDLKKDIQSNYDIIFTKNSYYIKNNVLSNSFTPYLEKEEELKYYAIYYNLKTITNNTLVYSNSKLTIKEKITISLNKIKSYFKYSKVIKKSLKYKLPNHYLRFKICYLYKAYLLIFLGLLIILLKIF